MKYIAKYLRKCTWAAVLVLASAWVFVPAAAGGNGYDDVYENEINEDTDLSVDQIENDDLRAFVKAAEEIQDIRADYADRIRSGGDEWYEDLRKEALENMVGAIEDAGLDEDTYRGIAYHVNADEELLSRIY